MTKDYLGEGSEELGRNLMKTFWVCLVEADVKPSTIYFINSSVKMVTNDSVHLDNIKKLADAGVEIAACGICLDYYGLKRASWRRLYYKYVCDYRCYRWGKCC